MDAVDAAPPERSAAPAWWSWLAALAGIYRQRKMPVLAWPAAAAQKLPPWSLVAGVEWMTVMASVLAFSPETNSRHLVQTGLMNVLGLVLVVETRGPARWAAGAGLGMQRGRGWGSGSTQEARTGLRAAPGGACGSVINSPTI